MRNEQYSAFICGKIVAICEAILNEEIGIIAGSRRLNRLEVELLHRKVGWLQRDEDFLTFVAIDSETDHLPINLDRHNWSLEALARREEEVAKAEAFYREATFAACRILIERFAMKNDI